MIKFFNCLSKKKEEFKPIEKNKVKMYSCGPTVYNYAHIGNLRAYIFADILKRTLEYFNFEVVHVMNITDVDDKTIRDSKKEFSDEHLKPNEILKKFTEKYTESFYEDIEKLNIKKPNFFPKATGSIKEMEFLIEKLLDKGFAYISDDGIYFDLKKVKDYGKLVNIDFSSQKKNDSNRMISDEYEKDNVQDFVLWKFKKEDNEPSWEVEFNKEKYVGRPGWHIECSAMSMKYLGNVFDIHTGGVDNKFPHHENEICQSSHALDIENQAHYWMHNEHLLVDGKKMSKSLGNFYTLRDLIEKGFSPIALREVYLRSNYRQQLNFTLESLKAGESNIKKINDFYIKVKNFDANSDIDSLKKINDEKLDGFELALKDDLNTPKAMSFVYEFIHEVNKKKILSSNDLEIAETFILRVDKVLGILNLDDDFPVNIYELADKRVIAKNEKNWELADELRNEIKSKGFEIKDVKDSKRGYLLSKL